MRTMSRPVLLVFLLLILIITSQFEWKQQLVPDLDTTPSISDKQNQNSKREEVVKEKVISFFLIHVILCLYLFLASPYFSMFSSL